MVARAYWLFPSILGKDETCTSEHVKTTVAATATANFAHHLPHTARRCEEITSLKQSSWQHFDAIGLPPGLESVQQGLTKDFDRVEEDDGGLCDDIASAVTLFLLGDDEGDREVGAGDVLGKKATLRLADLLPTVPPSKAVLQGAMTSSPQPLSLCATLSPPNVDDFLEVLRRRPLPKNLTGDTRVSVCTAIKTCILSLYRDRIEPKTSNVRRRLSNCPRHGRLAVQALLPLCARETELFRVVPPMSGEQPVILLKREPQWFSGWAVATDTYAETKGQDHSFGHVGCHTRLSMNQELYVLLQRHPQGVRLSELLRNLPALQTETPQMKQLEDRPPWEVLDRSFAMLKQRASPCEARATT